MTHERGGIDLGGGGGGGGGAGEPCVQVKPLASPPLRKNRIPLDLNFPHLVIFSGMLQLLCTYDPQLSQGLTV
jgi:hypothetical protein